MQSRKIDRKYNIFFNFFETSISSYMSFSLNSLQTTSTISTSASTGSQTVAKVLNTIAAPTAKSLAAANDNFSFDNVLSADKIFVPLDSSSGYASIASKTAAAAVQVGVTTESQTGISNLLFVNMILGFVFMYLLVLAVNRCLSGRASGKAKANPEEEDDVFYAVRGDQKLDHGDQMIVCANDLEMSTTESTREHFLSASESIILNQSIIHDMDSDDCFTNDLDHVHVRGLSTAKIVSSWLPSASRTPKSS